MSRLPRIGIAVSALAIAASLTGCAQSLSTVSARASKSDIAPATRAQAALAAGETDRAVELAEKAVLATPDDELVRALLGNTYFASGRFASAESAFRNSLSLAANQPKVALKLALVQIAQGNNGGALETLAAARPMLDAADLGLALALAGRANDAVAVLDSAARMPGADSRVRQNLALAHGLAGDWLAARLVAEQDLAAAQVDARLQQWMSFAKPVRASDQVAALTGVVPNHADPGQPVRLALAQPPEAQPARSAEVQFPESPAPTSTPSPQSVELAGLAPMAPMPVAQPVAPVPPIMPEMPAPVAETAYVAPVTAAFERKAPVSEPTPAAAVKLAKARTSTAPKAQSRPKAKDSGVVVQLGAYSSPERVERAWDMMSKRYSSLRDYTPTSARFDGDDGTVYRLAVKGFASNSDAGDFCADLKRKGRNCFVRRVAGDSPVRFASR